MTCNVKKITKHEVCDFGRTTSSCYITIIELWPSPPQSQIQRALTLTTLNFFCVNHGNQSFFFPLKSCVS